MAERERPRRTYGTGAVFFSESKGYWIGADRDANGKKHQVYAKTEKEAERKLRDLQKRIARGETGAVGRTKLADFLKDWLESVRRRRAYGTYETYESAVRLYIIPHVGNVQLGKLAVRQVQSWLDDLADTGMSHSRLEVIRATLQSALSTAERRELVTRNVVRLTELAREEATEIEPFTPEEVEQLLGTAYGDRLEALYVLTVNLGLRIGEVLGLSWSDVDLRRGRLQVRRQLVRKGGDRAAGKKGEWRLEDLKSKGSRRTLQMPAAVIDALRRHRARQLEERLRAGDLWPDWDLVFRTERGEPMHKFRIEQAFYTLLGRAELPRKRFHDLRHTCASLLIAQGVEQYEISRTLGHASITITANIYGHMYEKGRQKVAAAMEQALGRKAQ